MRLENINYRTAFFYIVLLSFIANCAPQTQYTWNAYDETVYNYYKNPGEKEEFIKELEETILEAEESGKIPPGLYAEYGYTFYEIGDFGHAAEYFQKEKATWPESGIFMNKMIRNCELQGKGGPKISPEAVEEAGKMP